MLHVLFLVIELFAISSPSNELNAAFTPDGRTVYFTRTSGTKEKTGTIVFSTSTRNGGWSSAEVARFSGRDSDYDPFLSSDGSQLFFISNRATKRDFDIWVVDRTGSKWGTPRSLGAPVNSEGDELYPAVAADGTLYFSSCGRADSRGRCDLYRSRLRDGRYLDPENLGNAINTPASETDAYISPDQRYLILTVYGRSDSIGDGDLYVSYFRDGAWSAPRSLGTEINTSAREYCPIVSPDGKFLYFTRQKDGLGDVHCVPVEALDLRAPA